MKLTDLKAGATVILDASFTCLDPGPHVVHHDPKADGAGFFVFCRGPFEDEDPESPNKSLRSLPYSEPHFLDGQEDESGELVGISAA